MASKAAMLLTQQEWEDLAAMVTHYRACTAWVERAVGPEGPEEHTRLFRRRLLAQRIIDAAAEV